MVGAGSVVEVWCNLVVGMGMVVVSGIVGQGVELGNCGCCQFVVCGSEVDLDFLRTLVLFLFAHSPCSWCFLSQNFLPGYRGPLF